MKCVHVSTSLEVKAPTVHDVRTSGNSSLSFIEVLLCSVDRNTDIFLFSDL